MESLAALVVVGMLALMLLSGVTTGRRVWERVETREAGGEALQAANDILRDRLEKTYPKARLESFVTSTDFTGSRDGVEFLSEPEDAGRPGAIRRYRLELTAKGDLVLSSTDELRGGGGARVLRQVLLTGVRRIELAYYGAAPPDGQARWRDEWSIQPTPPEMVRLRLEFARGDPRVWPELLVRPLATIDTGCRIDTTFHRCKGRG